PRSRPPWQAQRRALAAASPRRPSGCRPHVPAWNPPTLQPEIWAAQRLSAMTLSSRPLSSDHSEETANRPSRTGRGGATAFPSPLWGGDRGGVGFPCIENPTRRAARGDLPTRGGMEQV